MTVVVVTKLRTSNLGNLALSRHLIEHARRNDVVIALDRPMALSAFSLDWLSSRSDPVRAIDWAARFIACLPTLLPPIPPPGECTRFVTPTAASASLLASMRPWLRGVKPLLPGYRRRWATLRNASTVLVAGAGAVTDHDSLVHLLVEVRALHLAGIDVRPICQSVTVTNPALRAALGHVYAALPRIAVRGASSKAALVGLGVAPGRIEIAADFVWWVESSSAHRGPRAGVGVSLTPGVVREAGPRLSSLIDVATGSGEPVTAISSDHAQDQIVLEAQVVNSGLRRQPVIADASHYVDDLASYRLIITARFHTAVLGLVAGTPVVVLSERRDDRAVETLTRLGYPVDVVRVDQDNAAVVLQDRVRQARLLSPAQLAGVVTAARQESLLQLSGRG